MQINRNDTAVVFIDPQNEVLSERGVAWPAVVCGPHRVWGPQTNDLVLQPRKRGMSRVILGGMLANMCVESHLRDLLEQGFEVLVARDATAGPRHPEWGYGYTAALINFSFLAHAVRYTADVVDAMKQR